MSIKKIVLPSNSKHEEKDPFLYGFIDSYLEYLEEEDYTERQHSDIDREFYKIERFPQWNRFVDKCDLDLFQFIDQEFEHLEILIYEMGHGTVLMEEIIKIISEKDIILLGYYMMYAEQF